MKKARLLDNGPEYFSTNNLYIVKKNPYGSGSNAKYYQGKDLNEPFLAVIVPTCAESGSCLDRSNFERFPRCRHTVEDNCGELFVYVTCNCEETKNALEGLENYPVIDEEHYSNLEYEAQQEEWNNWGYTELGNELKDILEAKLDFESIELIDDISSLREIVESHYNVMNEESDGSFYLDTKQTRTRIEDTPINCLLHFIKNAEIASSENDFTFNEWKSFIEHNIKILNSETGEEISPPSYVYDAINPNQIVLVA
jgi:hypothetical protein